MCVCGWVVAVSLIKMSFDVTKENEISFFCISHHFISFLSSPISQPVHCVYGQCVCALSHSRDFPGIAEAVNCVQSKLSVWTVINSPGDRVLKECVYNLLSADESGQEHWC